MKRIGLLGGTFNPIHIGHLTIAQVAYDKLNLDKVIFVPSFWPPHKSCRNVIPASHRYRMVELAVQDNQHFEVSDFEVKKGGKSYSIDTVKHFQNICPKGTKIFFIIGEDSLETLSTWKDVDEIVKLATFVVVNRAGYKKKSSSVKVRSLVMPGLDVASSYVRRKIAAGETVKYLLPERVLYYIRKKKLYAGP